MPKKGFAEDAAPLTTSFVILRLEDSPQYVFNLSRLAGPDLMRIEIGQAILAWSAESKGIRRTATLHSVRRSVSAWLRWVRDWNNTADKDAVWSISDVGPFHIVRYRDYLSGRHSPETARGYLTDLRSVLRRSPGTTAATLRSAIGPLREQPQPTPIERYTPQEFSLIRNSARRLVEKAHRRIHTAHLEALTEVGPKETRSVRGRALYEVMTLGAPQTQAGFESLGATHAGSREPAVSPARRLLFLSADEAFAAAVLMASIRGINLSAVLNASQPVRHGLNLWQLAMDKPRRGTERFWPEIIDGTADPKAGRAIRMIVECTDPARSYLDASGTPTTTLLIRWTTGGLKVGIPQTKTRSTSKWVPDGIHIDFSRIRRSVPGTGVAKEPTDHNPATYLHYVKTDPIALQEHQVLAATGIQAAMDTARQKLHIEIRADRELSAETDALIVNCSDPNNNPDTHAPCTSGFYSFLDCLDCGNAATVARLIPRQLAAVMVLEQLRDALGESWETKFARRYYVLKAMLERHTPAERDLAALSMADHIPAILNALRYEVPK